MGRAYSEPTIGDRVSDSVYVIYRVVDPDDEFARSQVLCRVYDPVSGTYPHGEYEWKDVGSSYDGNAVEFRHRYEATQAIGLMLFGRDSVSVSYEL